jgi:hypothetical protein
MLTIQSATESLGISTANLLLFSLPPPLAIKSTVTVLPGTSST